MKQYALHFLLNLALLATSAADLAGQTPCGDAYSRIIAEGDAFMKKGNYKEAFEKYRAARGCTEAEHQVLDQKTSEVLHAVEGERVKADKSAAWARQQQKKAEAALRSAEEATAKAEAAEKKANAVLDKIYFYNDRFGLAYENGKYGFIDKELNTKIDFKYMEAMSFDYTGFAWVKRLDDNENQIQFVIDTLGNEYPLAYDVSEIIATTTALDLRNRDLDSLPLDIFRHTQLKILMLAGNQLKRLPPEIGNLKNLIFLGLSRNELAQLPPEVGHLENLASLQIFVNQLTHLPPELGNLKSLISLDIGNNDLMELPPEIGNLKSLASLDLRRNELTQLPPELKNLKSLTSLNLGSNKLTQLPAALGDLKNLNFLDISFNRLDQLPQEIGDLKSLIRLDCSQNQLTQLPRELAGLKSLRDFDLHDNQLLQPELKKIKELLPKCRIDPLLYEEEVEELIKQTQAGERLLKVEGTTVSQIEIAGAYNDLAWYQLLAKQFSEAEHSVRRGLEIDSRQLSLYTNLPPSLLLQNDPAKEAEALRLYSEWKDKDYAMNTVFTYWIDEMDKAGTVLTRQTKDSQKFRDIFLKDFKYFESEGIIPPSRQAAVARVKKLLQE